MKQEIHTTDITGPMDVDAPRPKYQVPSMKVMNESEVLVAFQMSAAKIGAAGCWWGTCNSVGGPEEDT